MDAKDRRYLRRFECGWCGQRLDRDMCSAIYERCSDEVRQRRRENCLAARRKRCAQ
jgi:hypothetical protein